MNDQGSRDLNVDTFDHVGERPHDPPAPTPGTIKAQVVRIGPPADARHAEIFAAGSIKSATVPVTRAFDSSDVIGAAEIREDGSAKIALAPGVDVGKIRHTGLGFRVIRSSVDGAGVRTIEELEPLCLGVEFAPALPVVGGMGEQWAEYLTAVELTTAPPAQLEELKRAYYAGAQGMYFAIMNATDAGDDGAVEDRLAALAREMADYLRMFKSREGLT